MRMIFKCFLIILTALSAISCSDNAIIDEYTAIGNENWSYDKPIKTVVDIKDASIPYNIYINFRHTEDYKYSNIWLRLSQIAPNNQKTTAREEFQLASSDGKWFGKGSGNLYSYRLIYKEGFKFDTAGKYTFIIEQNMRDNPLKAVTDVGLRAEPAK